MAEIAIPLIALGSMYVIANQDKDDKGSQVKAAQEGFVNMGLPADSLPPVKPPLPVENYPVTAKVSPDNVRRYPNANQATDKYFNQTVYERVAATQDPPSTVGGVGGGACPTMSLTGEPINKGNFKHNNMVPFFGAKIKGATSDPNVAESRLDNMQGAGSQLRRKEERAPLFKPHKDLQYAMGAPNVSDFMQSRMNPSMRMANVKPWEEQRVAPGLGKGFTSKGGAGFNSGMEDRDAWLPKTVNELRVDTNPKMTFGLAGHEGPAVSSIKVPANTRTQGQVEKYAPDTYYSVGPQRWFTTTGLEKAQTARGVEVLQHVNRPTTNCEYYGAGKDGDATYAKGEYRQPHRPVLETYDVINPSLVGKHGATEADYGSKSYQNLPNNRSTTRPAEEFGAVQGIVRAMVAPVLDLLRPSRKENTVGNIRTNGNAGSTVSNLPVYNPADRTRTTIREMTEGKLDNNHLNIENQKNDGYLVSEQQPVEVQRDTTNCQYTGNAGPSAHSLNQTYNAAYRQHNNVNKTYPNHPNQGGTQIFNQNDNISIHRKDEDRVNNRMWAPSGGPSIIPSTETYGKMNAPQYYNECQGCDRINPDILTAFKANPYTQSLKSWA